MPKRKRANASASASSASPPPPPPPSSASRSKSKSKAEPAGTTFSLMDGKIDILQGLILHEETIPPQFEDELISHVVTQCERGRAGELKKPTYLRTVGARSQGNMREMIMYGGFFDFNRARPGKRGLVPPFPPVLERLVDHLISERYLPGDVRPDSCIINRYDAGDCIPPHVDHKSYARPISTLSLLGEEPMLVGSKFRTVRSSVWEATKGRAVPLARRSLLVLGGNSGNIAKHCISRCNGPRISITLRKQPPPDWRPDESELVGGKHQQGGGVNDGGEESSQNKKKALSGSAKRRKKMMNRGGGFKNSNTPTAVDITDAGKAGKSDNTTKKVKKGKGNSEQEAKKSEKQARRNARRLEKKGAAAASVSGA